MSNRRLHSRREKVACLAVVLFGAFLVLGGVVYVQCKFIANAATAKLSSYFCSQSSDAPGYGTAKADNTHSCKSSKITDMRGKYTTYLQKSNYIQPDEKPGDIFHAGESMAFSYDKLVVIQVPSASDKKYYRHLFAFDVNTKLQVYHTATDGDGANSSDYTNRYGSKSLWVGHANGMTFNSRTNEIMTTNNSGDISLFDGDSGAYKYGYFRDDNGNKNTELHANALAHCPVCTRGNYIELQTKGSTSATNKYRFATYKKSRFDTHDNGYYMNDSFASIVDYPRSSFPKGYSNAINDIATNGKYFFHAAVGACINKTGDDQKNCYTNYGEYGFYIYQFDMSGNFVHAYYFPPDSGEYQGMDFGPDGTPYVLMDYYDKTAGWQNRDWAGWRVYKITDESVKKQMGVTTATINYDANGGSVPVGRQTVAGFKYARLNSAVPTKNNCVFKGYRATKLDGTEVILQPGDVILPTDYARVAVGSSASIRLSAVWLKKKSTETITISYNANGGIGAPSTQLFMKGGEGKLASKKPSRSGYSFLGWSTNRAANIAPYAPGASAKFTSDTVLYAIWERNESVTPSGGGSSSSNHRDEDVVIEEEPYEESRTGEEVMEEDGKPVNEDNPSLTPKPDFGGSVSDDGSDGELPIAGTAVVNMVEVAAGVAVGVSAIALAWSTLYLHALRHRH